MCTKNTFETTDDLLLDSEIRMDGALTHLEDLLLGIRTGRANPSLLDSLRINYCGCPVKLNQLANVMTSDARTISIRAFDMSSISLIEKAILQSKLGLTPQKAGSVIHLPIPPLSEERRKQLVLQVKDVTETQRISIRNIRRDSIKTLENMNLSEDVIKSAKNNIELLTKNFIAKLDSVLHNKINLLLDVANQWPH